MLNQMTEEESLQFVRCAAPLAALLQVTETDKKLYEQLIAKIQRIMGKVKQSETTGKKVVGNIRYDLSGVMTVTYKQNEFYRLLLDPMEMPKRQPKKKAAKKPYSVKNQAMINAALGASSRGADIWDALRAQLSPLGYYFDKEKHRGDSRSPAAIGTIHDFMTLCKLMRMEDKLLLELPFSIVEAKILYRLGFTTSLYGITFLSEESFDKLKLLVNNEIFPEDAYCGLGRNVRVLFDFNTRVERVSYIRGYWTPEGFEKNIPIIRENIRLYCCYLMEQYAKIGDSAKQAMVLLGYFESIEKLEEFFAFVSANAKQQESEE